MVRVRPVGAPQNPIAERIHKLAGQRDRVGVGRALPRAAVRPADLHPDEVVRHQPAQGAERRLIAAPRRVDARHVIDDHRHRGSRERWRQIVDELGVEMQLQVPTDFGKALGQRDDLGDRRLRAQVLHVVEPHAAEAPRGEVLQLIVGHGQRHQGDAAIGALLGGDRIGDDAVVEAMTARLHDRATRDSEHGVQREQALLGGVGGREGPIVREGKYRLRTEDVAVRVARARRQAHPRSRRRGTIRSDAMAQSVCAWRPFLNYAHFRAPAERRATSTKPARSNMRLAPNHIESSALVPRLSQG